MSQWSHITTMNSIEKLNARVLLQNDPPSRQKRVLHIQFSDNCNLIYPVNALHKSGKTVTALVKSTIIHCPSDPKI